MNLKKLSMLLISAAIATAGACSAQPQADQDAGVAAEPQDSQGAAPQDSAGNTFAGKVVETMDAGAYTYVLVEADGQEIWAAATHFEVEVGDEVVVPLEMAMEDFHSDTLDRDFPLIYFVSMIARNGEDLGPTMPPGHPPVAGIPASHGVDHPAPLEPAAGGVTIEQIWTDTQAISGSTVTVRGRVVKFNGGILGTNWMHIQDGTGDPSAGTHDLTVTSPGTASVGDVITVTGPVMSDQDFGAGYSYPVMIKDATVVVE